VRMRSIRVGLLLQLISDGPSHPHQWHGIRDGLCQVAVRGHKQISKVPHRWGKGSTLALRWRTPGSDHRYMWAGWVSIPRPKVCTDIGRSCKTPLVHAIAGTGVDPWSHPQARVVQNIPCREQPRDGWSPTHGTGFLEAVEPPLTAGAQAEEAAWGWSSLWQIFVSIIGLPPCPQSCTHDSPRYPNPRKLLPTGPRTIQPWKDSIKDSTHQQCSDVYEVWATPVLMRTAPASQVPSERSRPATDLPSHQMTQRTHTRPPACGPPFSQLSSLFFFFLFVVYHHMETAASL
jgi:hypothetical protein